MKKRAKSVPKVDPYIDGLMAKLLERLVSLERKMDSVVSHVSRMASGSGNQPKGSQPPAMKPQAPRHERTMYEAVCADCSKVCEVPFKPSEDRAVYCKACWAVRKSGGGPAPAKKGFPMFTPVSLPPKPVSKLSAAAQAAALASQASAAPKKAKKSAQAKKAKKKKSRR